MKQSLFAYGTLKDPRIQDALFGRRIATTPAYILGWGLYMAQDGYLFVKPLSGGRVDGVLIELESQELSRADLWEDLTVYERETCSAVLDSGMNQLAYIYTRKKTVGTLYTEKKLHSHTIEDILSEIQNLKE